MKIKENDYGQATVEVALLIPVLAIFLMLIVQVGLVAKQHVVVTHASRAGAREASVNKNLNEAKIRANKSAPNANVQISGRGAPGEYVTVKVSDTVESSLPILGFVFPNITVSGETTMRVEK